MRFDGDAYDKVFPRKPVEPDLVPDDEKMVDEKPDEIDDEIVDNNPPVKEKQPNSEIPEDETE